MFLSNVLPQQTEIERVAACMQARRAVLRGEISDIYHFLRAAFGQGVTIAQIVDFNIADIVTVLLVDLVVEGAAGLPVVGRLDGAGAGAGAQVLCAAVSSRPLQDCGVGLLLPRGWVAHRHAARPSLRSARH